MIYKEDFINNKITTKTNIKDNLIGVMRVGNEDYISLTDIAVEFASWIDPAFK